MAKFAFYFLISFLVLLTASPVCQAVLLSNNYIEVSINDTTGQFTMGLPNNGPILLYGHPNPWSSFTTVQLDATNFTNYSGPIGTLTTAPYNSGDSNITVFNVNNILEVTQTLTIVTSWTSGDPDWVMIKYSIKNNDASSHNVAVRVMLDTMLGPNDGAPFRIPGTGAVTHEMEFDSASIPNYYLAFDDLTNPTVVSQGTLQGELATKPDRFVTADWSNIVSTEYDFTVDPDKPFDGSDGDYPDSAVGVYWFSASLGSGESGDFVTYYGVGSVEIDGAVPLVVGLTSPGNLSVIDKELSPNPFTIVAFLENSAVGVTETLTGITTELSLPFGLELASGETALKTVDDLAVGANTQVSWNVNGTGIIGGDLWYTVEVAVTNTGVSPNSKSVSKRITLADSVTGFAKVLGDGQVSLNWTNLDFANLSWNNLSATSWAGTLMLRRAGNYGGTLPTNGTSYNAGDSIGAATVVYCGSGNYSSSPLTDTDLTNDTRYYYTAFTYDNTQDYIPAGAGIFVTPVAADTTPPADVTNFTATGGSSVTLTWTNPSLTDYPDFKGVKILRKTATYPTTYDDPNATYIYDGTGTSYVDNYNISNGTIYYYTAFTYDEVPNYSSGVSANAIPSAGNGGGGGGGCFIATAAYGTPMAEEVKLLSEFRDEYLLTNELGRGFVAFYYKHGPQWAEFISDNEELKSLVRVGLKPMSGLVSFLTNQPSSGKL